MFLYYGPFWVTSSLIFTAARRGTDEAATTKGCWEYEIRWCMRNTENSAWHRVNSQHMLRIVTLLSLCQVYPVGHAALSGTCVNGLYLSLVAFPFPCQLQFFSRSLISRALINTKVVIAFCFTARVVIIFP